jgi:MerR family mercuric resistance operon transcriptional regulator
MMDKMALRDTAPRLPIGELSRRTGVNIETVRYYEKIGLMPAPARSEGGHRLYGRGHLLRLNFVRRARDLGFTLNEIRDLLELAEQCDLPCAEARVVAAAHLLDVRVKVAALRKMEKVLVEMVARCADGSTPDCPILEALFEPGGGSRPQP